MASSLNETANQKVFRLATEADPKGIRTLGVLTKPDVLQKGDEARVIEVARNNVTVLNHGWFVVRNRSTEEVNQGVSIEQRNNNEQSFFNKVPWNLLQKSRVGVQSLERFLRALLDDHVRKEFPNLCKELDNKIQSAERELEVLGPRRDTPDEQRRTLLKLANEFQNISNNALMGYYKSEILGQDEMKIRMHVQNANDFFSQRVVNEGHEIQFDDINDGTDVEEALEDETSIYSAIREQYRRSRGPELPGMVNPIIVQNLFKWQSSKWEDFARHHVATIRTKVETFNSVLLNHVCGNDSAMEGRIKSKLRTTIQAAYNAADREISSILKDEREGILLTLDNYYSEQLEQSRKERTSTNIARNTRKVLAASTTTTTTISSPSKNQTVTPFAILPPTIPAEATDEERTDLLQAYLEHMTFTLLHNTPTTTTNDIQSITDIHDILKSYYTVARKRFIDNIAAQVIERHFLQYTAGPIRCFSPEWVGGLAVEELAGIAGEEWVKSTRRSMLAGKLGKWREARGLVDRGF